MNSLFSLSSSILHTFIFSLRHGTHSKFAKNLKRYGKFDNDETKQAYFELIRQRDELMKKSKQVNNLNQSDSDSDASSDNIEDLNKLKADALAKITHEMSSSSEGDNAGSDSEMDGFDESAIEKKKQKSLSKKAKTGVMGLKFMQKAEKAQKEIMKQKSKMLIDEIKNYEDDEQEMESEEDEDVKEDDNESYNEIDIEDGHEQGEALADIEQNEPNQDKPKKNTTDQGKLKFKGEVADTFIPANVNLSNNDVKDISAKISKNKKIAKTVTNKNTSNDHIDKALDNSEIMTSEDLVKQWQGSVNKISGKKRQKFITFDPKTDLNDFKINDIKNNRKRIKIDEIDKEDGSLNLNKIYITNEDLERENFERQKQNIIEDQMNEELQNEDKADPANMEG